MDFFRLLIGIVVVMVWFVVGRILNQNKNVSRKTFSAILSVFWGVIVSTFYILVTNGSFPNLIISLILLLTNIAVGYPILYLGYTYLNKDKREN